MHCTIAYYDKYYRIGLYSTWRSECDGRCRIVTTRHDGGAADEAATNAQDVSSSTRPGNAQGGTDQRVYV